MRAIMLEINRLNPIGAAGTSELGEILHGSQRTSAVALFQQFRIS